jgi:hypothetical protein
MEAIWRGLPPAAVDADLRAAGGAWNSAVADRAIGGLGLIELTVTVIY